MGQQRVVIVGSGFAGFECARALTKLLRRHRRRDVEIVLVSPLDYLLYTSLLPDVAGGLLDPRAVAVPLAESLPGVRLVRGVVRSVDLDAHTLTIADADADDPAEDPADDGGSGDTGSRTERFDRLVLTPGSVTRLLDIPGLAEHARGLKTLAEALYLRDHLLDELELADSETDETRRRARRTVVVVGASYAGTELVAQLRALADAAAHSRGFSAGEVRFLLLDTASKVMPEVGGDLGDRALRVLRGRGIEVRLGTTLTEIGAEHVVLSDHTVVPARTVAWVTGVTASPLVARLGLPLSHGRLVVTAELGVPGHPDVFAAGDAAAVPDLTKAASGGAADAPPTPPTAQHALRQGRALARNVAAGLGIGTAAPYRHHDLGLVVDLGPHYAVADPLGAHLSGFPAKLVTRAYHLYAIPHGANRWAVGLGWLTDLVSPRPLVSLGLVQPGEAAFAGSEHE